MIALDISSEFLYVLELTTGKKGTVIQAYTREPFPDGINSPHTPPTESLGQAIQIALKRCPKRHPWHKHKVIMALPVNQTLIKNVPILKEMSKQDLHEHLQHVVSHQTAASMADVFWDYACLPAVNPANPDAVIVIAQQTIILAYLHLLAAHHFTLEVVDVENYALARVFYVCYPELVSTAKTYGILLLRREIVTFVAINLNQMVFSRATPLENQDHETLARVVLQLIKSIPSATTSMECTTLFLAGDYATNTSALFLRQKLSCEVKVVELPAHIKINKSTEHFSFASYFLSFGLALWETSYENREN